MRTLLATAAVVLFIGLLSAPGHTEAQVGPPPGLAPQPSACTPVTFVPITIAASGVSCLTGPLDYPRRFGAAIVIDARHVVLDLNGFRLGGFAGPGTEAVGITSSERLDITVRNGTVEGFECGIDLRGARYLVEDIHSARHLEGEIQVLGSRHIVRNNRVRIIGGSPAFAWGIFANGRGVVFPDGAPGKYQDNLTSVSPQWF